MKYLTSKSFGDIKSSAYAIVFNRTSYEIYLDIYYKIQDPNINALIILNKIRPYNNISVNQFLQ